MPLLTRFDSKTIPGASFVLKSPGRKFRNRVELSLFEVFHRQTLIAQEQEAIIPIAIRSDEQAFENRLKMLTREEQSHLDVLRRQMEHENARVTMAYAEAMLESFTLPGEEYAGIVTHEDLFESAPADFADEIILASLTLWRLTGIAKKNSSSPSIKPAAEDGPTTNGTVTLAANEETTDGGTVA